MKVLFASSLALASALDFAPLWADFKREHGKVYDEVEEARRRSIFEANLRFIHEENSKGHDFELAVNAFADLSPEEFAASYLGLADSKEALAKREGLTNLGQHEWRGESLPEDVDWAERGAVSPVKDQQACGSCWAFSAVGALEGAAQLARGGEVQQLSEQQLVDCDKDQDAGCQGGMMDFAFQYAQGAALCSEQSYPYEASDGSCRSKDCEAALEAGAVTGFTDVGHRDEDLMSALAQQPVSVAIQADMPTFQFYKSGVMGKPCGATLDHGVLAVGYGTWSDGKPYWKVKNSWGANWGMDGYILLKRGTKPWKKTGPCGILKMASFPVVSPLSDTVV